MDASEPAQTLNQREERSSATNRGDIDGGSREIGYSVPVQAACNASRPSYWTLVEKKRSVGQPCKYSPSKIEAAINEQRSNLERMGIGINNGKSNLEGMSCSWTGSILERRRIDRFLWMLPGLSPKVMVIVEKESSNNNSHLMDRLVEALYYYSAMFDSLESTLPQQSIDRVTLEKYFSGKQIHNIMACEGSERVERREIAKVDEETRLSGIRTPPHRLQHPHACQQALVHLSLWILPTRYNHLLGGTSVLRFCMESALIMYFFFFSFFSSRCLYILYWTCHYSATLFSIFQAIICPRFL